MKITKNTIKLASCTELNLVPKRSGSGTKLVTYRSGPHVLKWAFYVPKCYVPK